MFENPNPRDLEQGRKHLMSGSVGGGMPVMIESGKGAVIKDVNGKEYIDCIAGHGVANIGHGRTEVAAALAAQERTSVRQINTENLQKRLVAQGANLRDSRAQKE